VASGYAVSIEEKHARAKSVNYSLFAAGSPFTGTWKLNPAKSTPPAPKSDTAVVDADHDGLKFNEDIVDDKGQPMKITYEAKFDGKLNLWSSFRRTAKSPL